MTGRLLIPILLLVASASGCSAIRNSQVDPDHQASIASQEPTLARSVLADRHLRAATADYYAKTSAQGHVQSAQLVQSQLEVEPASASPRAPAQQELRPPDSRTPSLRVAHPDVPSAPSDAQPPRQISPPPPRISPRSIIEGLGGTDPEPVPLSHAVEIDFSSALAIAAGQNPRIAFADARLREASARWHAAKRLWLPSLRAGATYNKHEGLLQETNGNVLDVSRSSLHSGLGVSAVGAGTPGVHGVYAQFHSADAIFEPRIASCAAAAEDSRVVAVTNDLLLETALAYLQLLGSTQQEAIATETLKNAEKLADLTASFARSGQGPQADADRAQTELAIRRNDVSRAEEAKRVAMARLAELLRMDPTVMFIPREEAIVPIELVADGTELSQLIATGLSNRPELAASEGLVCEAASRLQREEYSMFLPSVILGASVGGFGGGLSGQPNFFRDRFDLDLGVYWEMRNLGFGERAAQAQASARVDQAQALQVAVMDRVAREIAEAHAQITARRGQISTAESAVESATKSYTRNTARIRNGQGLPIEVLQSIQALDQARREYLRTLTDYNEAQFRLHRALGWPLK